MKPWWRWRLWCFGLWVWFTFRWNWGLRLMRASAVGDWL